MAHALGAERTPEVFLFDRDRRLVYHGAIDDSRDETAVHAQYLRDALEAVLAGRTPEKHRDAAGWLQRQVASGDRPSDLFRPYLDRTAYWAALFLRARAPKPYLAPT